MAKKSEKKPLVFKNDDIKVVLLHEGAKIPEKGTERASGYDIVNPYRQELIVGRSLIKTGLKKQPADPLRDLDVRPRSGMSCKGFEVTVEQYNRNMELIKVHHKMRVDADVLLGLGDNDYTGEYSLLMRNTGVILVDGMAYKNFFPSESNVRFFIEPGVKMAQIKFNKVIEHNDFVVVDELDETERGEGGYGHTDKK